MRSASKEPVSRVEDILIAAASELGIGRAIALLMTKRAPALVPPRHAAHDAAGPGAADMATHRARAALDEVIERHGTVEELTIAYVALGLARHRGNKVHTARALGVNRRTIQRWLREHRLPPRP